MIYDAPMELPEKPSFLNKEAIMGALLASLFVIAACALFIAAIPGSVDRQIAASFIIVAQITFIGAASMGTIAGAANGKSHKMVEYFQAKQSYLATMARRDQISTIEPRLEPEVLQSQSQKFTAMVERQKNAEKVEELSL